MQMILDDNKLERENMENDYKRQIKQRDEQSKAQNEAYKYKLQYLEVSQQELKGERKRWQDKEREFEKNLVTLAAELRELRAEHQQAVDLHESFRGHVEAKEAARSAESSSWDIKKKAQSAEHALALRQGETERNARVSQLERELLKVKDELNDALEEIETLTAGMKQAAAPAPQKRAEYKTPSTPTTPAPRASQPQPVQPQPVVAAAPPPAEPVAEPPAAAAAPPAEAPPAEEPAEAGF